MSETYTREVTYLFEAELEWRILSFGKDYVTFEKTKNDQEANHLGGDADLVDGKWVVDGSSRGDLEPYVGKYRVDLIEEFLNKHGVPQDPEAQMREEMDAHIDSIVEYPAMHVGRNADEGGMQAAEDQLILLLEYRFPKFDFKSWMKAVSALWPEDAERPGSVGHRLAVLHGDEDTFDKWSKDAAAIVKSIRAQYAHN